MRALRVIAVAAFFAYLAVLFAALHAMGPDLYGSDDHYNVRFANLLPAHGIDRTFEWMQMTSLKDHFSDKEFLFHVLLIPFTRSEGGMVLGGKIAALLFACAVCVVSWKVFVAIGVPWPLFWTFLLVSSSSLFLHRFAFLRSYFLSLIFVALGFWLHASGRWKWLALLGFLYAWSYSAPHVLVMLSCAWVAAVLVTERRLDWKPLAASLAGVAAGLAVHPYTPESLRLWWQINVQVITMAWGGAPESVTMGFELTPLPLEEYGFYLPGTVVLTVVGAFLAVRTKAVLPRFALFWTAIALALFTRSARFIEYLAPAAVFLGAAVAMHLKLDRVAKGAAVAAALGLHAWAVHSTFTALAYRVEEMPRKVEPLYEAAGWARANLPKGEALAHVEWDEFGYLWFKNPDHLYVAGLDPTFAWIHDPEGWTYLQSLKRQPSVSGAEIRRRLGMRYILVKDESLRAALQNAPDARELHRNALVSIFELAP